MRRVSAGFGFVLGMLTSIPIIVITFFGQQQYGLPFPVFDLFDLMARILPGKMVTFGIDTIVKIISVFGSGGLSGTAKLAEHGIAIVQFVLIGGIVGLIIALFGRRSTVIDPSTVGLGTGAVLFGFFTGLYVKTGFPPAGIVVSVAWLGVVFIGWCVIQAAMVRGVAVAAGMPEDNPERRKALYLGLSGLLAFLTGAFGLGYLWYRRKEAATTQRSVRPLAPERTSGPAASPSGRALARRWEPVPGTRPEVTPNPDFYRVDINSLPPQLNTEEWRLEIGGAVASPLKLTLPEIREMPAISQYITLACISNPVGGDLISTTLLTGVPLATLMQKAGIRTEEVQGIQIECADGFYETVSAADMQDPRTLLAYAMNQEPLPAAHGFPLRIYIPNRYGMKQPKWITRLTAISGGEGGFWEDRGWSQEARPHIVSIIDTVNQSGDGAVEVGGIAWAGDRGIQQVELQVDDGDWEPAELRSPPLSPLTWIQWRYQWQGDPGKHEVRVRAYDGTGARQIMQPGGPNPAGATGVDQQTFTI